MLKQVSVFVLCVAAIAGLSAPVWSERPPLAFARAGPQPAGEQAKAFTFDGNGALAGWTTHRRRGHRHDKRPPGWGGSLKVGPAARPC